MMYTHMPDLKEKTLAEKIKIFLLDIILFAFVTFFWYRMGNIYIYLQRHLAFVPQIACFCRLRIKWPPSRLLDYRKISILRSKYVILRK